MNPTRARLVSAITENGTQALLGLLFQDLSDSQLQAAWQRTDGEPGDPIADLLCAEAERRNLEL